MSTRHPHAHAGSRTLEESIWETPATQLFQERRTFFAAAAAFLFLVVFVLALLLDQIGVAPLLYVLPIALLAALSGARAGIGAALVAAALTLAGGALGGASPSPPLLAGLFLAFLIVGALGRFRRRPVSWWLGWLPRHFVKAAVAMLSLVLFLSALGISAPGQGQETAVVQQQQSAREEEAAVGPELRSRLASLLASYMDSDEFDEADLRRYVEMIEALEGRIGGRPDRAALEIALEGLSAAAREEEVQPGEAAAILGELGRAEDRLLALRQAHTAHALVPAADPVSTVAASGAVDARQAAQLAALLEAELPGSRAAGELRANPGGASVVVVGDPAGGPDWLLVAVESLGGPLAVEGVVALIGFAARRRRGIAAGVASVEVERETEMTKALVERLRGEIEAAFGIEGARVVAWQQLEGSRTRFELASPSGTRLECHVADATVLDAAVLS